MSKVKITFLITVCLALLVYPCIIQPYIEYGSLRIRAMALPAAIIAAVILAKRN